VFQVTLTIMLTIQSDHRP